MSTRSIKVKLLAEKDKKEETQRAFQTTHEIFNSGVEYYMNWLLRMRQADVMYLSKNSEEHSLTPAADWQKELLTAIEQKEEYNFFAQKTEMPEMNFEYDDLKRIEKIFVFLSKGIFENEEAENSENDKTKKGKDSKSSSSSVFGLLTNPESEAMQGASKAGSKPRWQKLKDKKNPDWELAKEIYDKSKLEEKQFVDNVILPLKAKGILPIFRLFSEKHYPNGWQAKQKWEKSMFKKAVERLKGWETWEQNVQNEKIKVKRNLEKFLEKNPITSEDWHQLLRKYEKQREEELKKVAFEPIGGFRIKAGSLKGWNELREKWLKKPDADFETLKSIINKTQTEMKGKFGDPELFRYLAKEGEIRNIWKYQDYLRLHVKYNTLIVENELKKEHANCTPPHPYSHPVWIEYEPPKGNNFMNYCLYKDGEKTFLKLPVLSNENGLIIEKEINLLIANSHQFEQIHFENPILKKKSSLILEFQDAGTNSLFQGEFAGAKLQFKRNGINELNPNKNGFANKFYSPAYFNISLSMNPFNISKKWLKMFSKNPDYSEAMKQIKIPNNANDNLEDALKKGLRIMSVDLGLRTLASCAVYELVRENDNDKAFKFLIDEKNQIEAAHKRSFIIRLSGEEPSNKILKKRDEIFDKRLQIRKKLNHYKAVKKLSTKENLDVNSKNEAIRDIITNYDMPDINIELEKMSYDDLNSPAKWNEPLNRIIKNIETNLSKEISQWRKDSRKKDKNKYNIGGLSFWHIEELQESRKLLLQWGYRSRTGIVKRMRKGYAYHLLEHINHLKDDRLKQGADCIIMHALGYIKNASGKWTRKYPPCQLIVFEDLSRYNFKTDRPKRENRQLMKWGHRAILDTVKMQAEIFGLEIRDTYAAFSSKYHAKTGAPGVRARIADTVFIKQIQTEYDKAAKKVKEELNISNPSRKQIADKSGRFKHLLESFSPEEIEPGMVLPWEGGELFVTLNAHHKPLVLQADINAAQNIGRRFLTSNKDFFRLNSIALEKDEEILYIPQLTTSRKAKYLKNLGCGLPVSINNSPFAFFKKDKKYAMLFEELSNKTLKNYHSSDEEEPETDDDLLHSDEDNQRAVLFRDMSGILFQNEQWLPAKIFWKNVHQKISQALKENKIFFQARHYE